MAWNYSRTTLTCLRPSTSPRRVKTDLTLRTHHDGWIDHAGATRRFVPLIFTDCPRSPDQAFVVSRLRIIRHEYFTLDPNARSGRAFRNLFVSEALPCAFSLKVTSSRFEFPKYRRNAMENLIIKTDVMVIITIFYISLNKSNEPAESISLQLQLTASAIYLRAHGLRFVSQYFITIFSRVWSNIIYLIKL